MDILNEILGWGSPIGIGIFIAGVAVTLYLLSKTIETLSKIDKEQNSKK
jgi:hypothetical protein